MIASISVLRLPLSSAVALRQRFRSISFISAASRHYQNQNPSQNVSRKVQQPNKSLLRARESVKQISSLAPVLSLEDKPQLSQNQAIGLVAASQANFMRVIVQSLPSESSAGTKNSEQVEDFTSSEEAKGGEGGTGLELLCVVRAVLKKIKRRVLVGDRVLVGSIDWVDRRGMIENVFQRKTEVVDPPVANVDHLVVLFSMDQPKPEPFSLTRFLVEAESTGIPFTLALNKSELATEEVWNLHFYLAILCLVSSSISHRFSGKRKVSLELLKYK